MLGGDSLHVVVGPIHDVSSFVRFVTGAVFVVLGGDGNIAGSAHSVPFGVRGDGVWGSGALSSLVRVLSVFAPATKLSQSSCNGKLLVARP